MIELRLFERTEYDGPAEPVLERAAIEFGLGAISDHGLLTGGYEDVNYRIETDEGEFVVKIFAREYPDSHLRVARYAGILDDVDKSDVNHPKVHARQGYHKGTARLVYPDRESGLKMVAMDYVPGQTFYERGSAPAADELPDVIEQAAKIHAIGRHVHPIADSWALQNLSREFAKAQSADTIPKRDGKYRRIVERTVAQLSLSDENVLPHTFVHGDMTRHNVIAGDDGKLYVLDFAVANWRPRIQELAVIASTLVHDADNEVPVGELAALIADVYDSAAPQKLTLIERRTVGLYAEAVLASTYLGALRVRAESGNSEETSNWLALARLGLSQI